MPAPDKPEARDAADLALLTEAARAAGQIALRHFRGDVESWEKTGGQGPVSDADMEVDRMLREELLAARPDYGWLSEETDDEGARREARLAARRIFVADPIDGTRAFLKGEETWGHALAVVEDGEVRAGVMLLPARGTLYAAARGGGATRDGEPIGPSGRERLDGAEALVNASAMRADRWKGPPPDLKRNFRASLCYRLCLVAQGRFDASISAGYVWEWDAAAGDVILSEAGAHVSDARGARPRYNGRTPRLSGLVAASPALGPQIVARLAPPD